MQVELWTFSGITDDVSVYLFNDCGNMPCAARSTLGVLDPAANSIAVYGVDKLHVMLPADTRYWIGLSASSQQIFWNMSFDTAGVTSEFTGYGNRVFSNAPNPVGLGRVHQMAVVSSVPEPDSYALLLGGLGLVGFLARRRQR